MLEPLVKSSEWQDLSGYDALSRKGERIGWLGWAYLATVAAIGVLMLVYVLSVMHMPVR